MSLFERSVVGYNYSINETLKKRMFVRYVVPSLGQCVSSERLMCFVCFERAKSPKY